MSFFKMIFFSIKSQFKSWYLFLLFIIIPPLLLFSVFYAVNPILSAALTTEKLSIAFCDMEGSTYFATLTNLLKTDKSVSKAISIEIMDYETALDELREETLDAVIVFPDRFIHDMINGINHPVNVVLQDANSLKSVFIKEFISSAATEISAAQSAINTTWHYTNTEKMSEEQINKAFNSIVVNYMLKAFSRSALYSTQTVSAFGGFSAFEFYMTSFLSIYIFFSCIFGIHTTLSQRKALLPFRLYSFGISSTKIALFHLSSTFVVNCLISSVILGFIGLLHSAASFPQTFISSQITVGSFLLCFLFLCIFCFLMSNFSLLLSQLFHHYYTAEIFFLSVGLAMMFLSGTIIPYSFLPDFFQSIGNLTFHKWAQKFLAASLFPAENYLEDPFILLFPIIVLFILSILFFILSTKLIRRNLEPR